MFERLSGLGRQAGPGEGEHRQLFEVEGPPAAVEQTTQHIAEHIETLRVENLFPQGFDHVFGVNTIGYLVEQDARQDAAAERKSLTSEHPLQEPARDQDVLTNAPLDQVGDGGSLIDMGVVAQTVSEQLHLAAHAPDRSVICEQWCQVDLADDVPSPAKWEHLTLDG